MALYKDLPNRTEDSSDPEKTVERVLDIANVLFHLEQVRDIFPIPLLLILNKTVVLSTDIFSFIFFFLSFTEKTSFFPKILQLWKQQDLNYLYIKPKLSIYFEVAYFSYMNLDSQMI